MKLSAKSLQFGVSQAITTGSGDILENFACREEISSEVRGSQYIASLVT